MSTELKQKPILCLDFDGVIHRYSRGWQDGSIYDSVVDGFFEWAVKARQFFKLVIYSSRSKTELGIAEMKTWLGDEIHTAYGAEPPISVADFEFAHEKPPAFLTIDDRAFTFRGDWTSPIFEPERLTTFKPWSARKRDDIK
jgi:hypothetical protein